MGVKVNWGSGFESYVSASSETTQTVRWKEGGEGGGKKRKKEWRKGERGRKEKKLYEPQKFDTTNNRQKNQNNSLEVRQSVKDGLLDMGNTELSAIRVVISSTRSTKELSCFLSLEFKEVWNPESWTKTWDGSTDLGPCYTTLATYLFSKKEKTNPQNTIMQPPKEEEKLEAVVEKWQKNQEGLIFLQFSKKERAQFI